MVRAYRYRAPALATSNGIVGHTVAQQNDEGSSPADRAKPAASTRISPSVKVRETTKAADARPPRSTVGSGLQVFDDPSYVTTSPTTLMVREKMFYYPGDNFSIKDQNGKVWFQCNGRVLTIREKKVITDARHREVFIMKEQLYSSSSESMYIYHPRNDAFGQHMFTVDAEPTFSKMKLYAKVRDRNTGKNVMLVLKGYSFESTVYIGEPKKGGRPIAKIKRGLIEKDFQKARYQYRVDIVPGVDAALIVAMCISFDELKENVLHS